MTKKSPWRPRLPDSKRMDRRVSFRVSPAVMNRLRAEAKRRGMTLAELMRSKLTVEKTVDKIINIVKNPIFAKFPPDPANNECPKCGMFFNPMDAYWRSNGESWSHDCQGAKKQGCCE